MISNRERVVTNSPQSSKMPFWAYLISILSSVFCRFYFSFPEAQRVYRSTLFEYVVREKKHLCVGWAQKPKVNASDFFFFYKL